MTTSYAPFFDGSNVKPYTLDLLGDQGELLLDGKMPERTVILFYASWCGACKSAKPKYKKLADALARDSNVLVAAMDYDSARAQFATRITKWKYDIKYYPTLVSFYKGKPYSIYTGNFEPSDLLAYVKNIGSKW